MKSKRLDMIKSKPIYCLKDYDTIIFSGKQIREYKQIVALETVKKIFDDFEKLKNYDKDYAKLKRKWLKELK